MGSWGGEYYVGIGTLGENNPAGRDSNWKLPLN